MPAAGTLRHRLAFQQPVDTPDGRGGLARTWQAVTPAFHGQMTPAAGDEKLALDQPMAGQVWLWCVRYDSLLAGLGPKWRFLWNGRIFEIQTAVNADYLGRRNVEWHGQATEVATT